MGKSAEASLSDFRQMLLADNKAATAAKYSTWASRFENWHDGGRGREALAGFDELLRDGDALGEPLALVHIETHLLEVVLERSTARIPSIVVIRDDLPSLPDDAVYSEHGYRAVESATRTT